MRLRLLLTLTALLGALVIPVQAHGNQPSSGPRAFWKTYPLQSPSRLAVTPSDRSRPAPPPVATLAKSSGKSGLPVLVVLVAAEALALAALIGRRRLRRSAGAASLRFPRRSWPPGTEQHWRAEVVWASGYRKGRFRAVAIPPAARRGRPIAATKMVDVTGLRAPDPVHPQFRAPFDHLVADLRRAGWQPVEPGSRWWSVRFVWTRSSRP